MVQMRTISSVTLCLSFTCVLNFAGEVIESVTADMEFLQSAFVKEFEKELNAPPGSKPKEAAEPVKVKWKPKL